LKRFLYNPLARMPEEHLSHKLIYCKGTHIRIKILRSLFTSYVCICKKWSQQKRNIVIESKIVHDAIIQFDRHTPAPATIFRANEINRDLSRGVFIPRLLRFSKDSEQTSVHLKRWDSSSGNGCTFLACHNCNGTHSNLIYKSTSSIYIYDLLIVWC